MKVVVIKEIGAGVIDVVAYNSKFMSVVIDLLIKYNYLSGKTTIYIEEFDNYIPIQKYYGDEWKECLKKMSIEEFNRIFDEDEICLDVFSVEGMME